MKRFWITATFANGDFWIDGYDAVAFSEALASAMHDINNHDVLKHQEMESIFCSKISNGYGILAPYDKVR